MGACPCDSSALPEHETVKRLATIATEYVVVKQGMCVEWGKTRINGKGAEVYKKHIYKGYTT